MRSSSWINRTNVAVHYYGPVPTPTLFCVWPPYGLCREACLPPFPLLHVSRLPRNELDAASPCSQLPLEASPVSPSPNPSQSQSLNHLFFAKRKRRRTNMRSIIGLVASVMLLAGGAAAAENCASVAVTAIPSCAQSCFLEGASFVGCDSLDFSCQCGKEAALYAAIEPCVATGCPAASFQAVINGASSGKFCPYYFPIVPLRTRLYPFDIQKSSYLY